MFNIFIYKMIVIGWAHKINFNLWVLDTGQKSILYKFLQNTIKQ